MLQIKQYIHQRSFRSNEMDMLNNRVSPVVAETLNKNNSHPYAHRKERDITVEQQMT